MDDSIYNKWSQLGVGFHQTETTNSLVDLEKTIFETSMLGRYDPRILFGMYHWLIKHHDLVNSYRLIRLVKKSRDTAVLGAIFEAVQKEHPQCSLKNIVKYCQKRRQKEFVFHDVANSKFLSKLNQQENLPLWKKWNLICRDLDDMSGVIMNKEYVLKNNPNLRLRALFGPGLRAEIFSYFLATPSGNIHKIAQSLIMDYKSVYKELLFFKSIGLVDETNLGRARIFSMDFKRLTKYIPTTGLKQARA